MHVVPAVKCEGKPRNELEFLHLWTSSKLVLEGSMQRNLLVVMERLCDISVLIGTQDQSADICQTYLDQPLTFANDALDLFVPNIGPDVLDDIIRKIKECNTDELSGRLRRHLWSKICFILAEHGRICPVVCRIVKLLGIKPLDGRNTEWHLASDFSSIIERQCYRAVT